MTTGEIRSSLGEGFLSADHFVDVIESACSVREVEVSGFGNPFFNRALPQIMEEAHRRGVALTADNGANLDHAGEDLLHALVEHRFRRITCPIDGACQKTHTIYRRGGNFDNVIRNIVRINELKAKFRSRYPELTWQFVVFGHNEREIPAARRMAAQLWMDFRLKVSWNPEFSPIRDRQFVEHQHVAALTRSRRLKELNPDRFGRTFCHQLWETPHINWDGRVLGCIINSWADFGSNAFRDGLTAAVNSESIRYARLMLLGKAEPRQDLPCSRCDVFMAMLEEGDFIDRGVRRLAYRAAKCAYDRFRRRRARRIPTSWALRDSYKASGGQEKK